MKKVIFSLLCLVMIPLSGFANDTNTQTNTSGSNTNITGGYTTTNNNTYQSGSSNDTTNTTTNNTTNTTTNQAQDTRVWRMSFTKYVCLLTRFMFSRYIRWCFNNWVVCFWCSYMIDENCERIKLSKTLSDLGMKVAACQSYVKMKECSLQWNNQAPMSV